MKFPLKTYITLFLAATALLQAEVTITAQFQPSTIAMGDPAQYVVTIRETSDRAMPEVERITSLPIPQSGGLSLINGRVGTPRQERVSINFKTEYAISQNLIIDATAPRIGNFTIPSFAFTYKGNTYTAPAATLTVVERPEGAPPPINELIFLKVDAPEQLYVGQTEAIQLKLYVHEQARYRGYDDVGRTANGFTVSELGDPSESVERVGDYRYRVLTWPLIITPIQSGPQDLSFEFSVVAEVPDQRNRSSRFGSNSPFGSSIFDNFFSRSERFNLYTQPTTINVLALPEAGKPLSFSGAVGDFSIQVATDAEDSRVGEPIMLSLKVSGSGNFDRISGPELAESSDWRSYKPEAAMESNEPASLKGVKRFDYVFIPQKAGKRMLPEVNFSFFDPVDKAYVELSAPPIAVNVAPSLQPQFTAPIAPAAYTPTNEQIELNKTLSPEEALLTLDYRPVARSTTGFGLLKQPSFYVLNSVALLALCCTAVLLNKRRRLRTDTDYAQLQAARQALKAAIADAATAEQQNKPSDFYRAAQEAIRLAATIRFGKNLRAAESTELADLFKASAQPQASSEHMQHLFQQADALRFSGQSAGSTDLHSARQQLDSILKAL